MVTSFWGLPCVTSHGFVSVIGVLLWVVAVVAIAPALHRGDFLRRTPTCKRNKALAWAKKPSDKGNRPCEHQARGRAQPAKELSTNFWVAPVFSAGAIHLKPGTGLVLSNRTACHAVCGVI